MTSNKKKEEEIIKGIIIEADFGYGMKYEDEENLYLKLDIQQFDGYRCVQLFHVDNVGKLLLQFKGDYRSESSLKTLLNQKVFLKKDDHTEPIPNAIAKLPPSQYPKFSWIYNNNWD